VAAGSARTPSPQSASAPNKTSVFLVLGCTFLGAAAQVLMKLGANALPPGASVVQMITCLPLLAGLAVYGLSTVLLILALRNSELSLMYPIIALTYVWVMILSVMIFNESLNAFKVLGVLVIVGGVAVLGRGSQR
jgi:multidrug transporter EmrE-like cation transporter